MVQNDVRRDVPFLLSRPTGVLRSPDKILNFILIKWNIFFWDLTRAPFFVRFWWSRHILNYLYIWESIMQDLVRCLPSNLKTISVFIIIPPVLFSPLTFRRILLFVFVLRQLTIPMKHFFSQTIFGLWYWVI